MRWFRCHVKCKKFLLWEQVVLLLVLVFELLVDEVVVVFEVLVSVRDLASVHTPYELIPYDVSSYGVSHTGSLGAFPNFDRASKSFVNLH